MAVHSDEKRQAVLSVYQAVGLREAERQTGVHRSTILRWAAGDGLDSAAIAENHTRSVDRAGAANAARVARERAEAHERILNRNLKIVEGAQARVIELLGKGNFDAKDLRALVEAFVKSTHDYQLLTGRATSRPTDNAEIVDRVVDALFGALNDVGLTQEVQDSVRIAFAARVRVIAAADDDAGARALEAGDQPDEDEVELDDEVES